MSLFIFHEETVSGTKQRINWKPIILLLAAAAIVASVIIFFTSRTGDIAPTTSAPAQPLASVPTQAPAKPADTPIASPGVVVLTTDELMNQIIQNPNKYKKGQIMQLTGPVRSFDPTQTLVVFVSNAPGWEIDVMPDPYTENGIVSAIIAGRRVYTSDTPVITVRATFQYVMPEDKTIRFDNATLAATGPK